MVRSAHALLHHAWPAPVPETLLSANTLALTPPACRAATPLIVRKGQGGQGKAAPCTARASRPRFCMHTMPRRTAALRHPWTPGSAPRLLASRPQSVTGQSLLFCPSPCPCRSIRPHCRVPLLGCRRCLQPHKGVCAAARGGAAGGVQRRAQPVSCLRALPPAAPHAARREGHDEGSKLCSSRHSCRRRCWCALPTFAFCHSDTKSLFPHE